MRDTIYSRSPYHSKPCNSNNADSTSGEKCSPKQPCYFAVAALEPTDMLKGNQTAMRDRDASCELLLVALTELLMSERIRTNLQNLAICEC